MTFFESYYNAAQELNDDNLRLQLYDTILDYEFKGIEPTEDANFIIRALFAGFKPNIDARAKRVENIKRMRKPKKTLGATPKSHFGNATDTNTDTEADTDKDTDKDTERDVCVRLATR